MHTRLGMREFAKYHALGTTTPSLTRCAWDRNMGVSP